MLLVEEGLGVLKGSTATDAQLSLLPDMQTCSSEETNQTLAACPSMCPPMGESREARDRVSEVAWATL